MKLIVKSPVWDDLCEIGFRIAEDNLEAADRFYIACRGNTLSCCAGIRASGACAAFL